MRFGIHVGPLGGSFAELRRLWRFADARGFHWFSVSDHFQELPPFPADRDCLEALAAMTAAALETRRLRVGCLTFSTGYRRPMHLARALCTIDHLAGGRVECGLGAGWYEPEYRAFGLPFHSVAFREDQLEGYARILRSLLRGRGVIAPFQPRVPIWIGGGGEKRTLRIAAKYADGWNVPYVDPATFRRKSEILDGWCEVEQRDPATIVRSINLGFYVGVDAQGARLKEALLRSELPDSRLAAGDGFLRGTVDQAVDLVGRYREAGVQQLNISLRKTPYDLEALAAFAEAALPEFAAA